MKILIIGEFSGLAKNLSAGFHQIGHESFVFSWGDDYKKIEQDKDSYTIKLRNLHLFGYYIKPFSFFNRFIESIRLQNYVLKLSKKGKWDKIIIVSPVFLKLPIIFWQPRFTKSMLLSLVNKPSDLFLLCCGEDKIPISFWGENPYSKPYNQLKQYVNHSKWSNVFFNYYSSFIKNVIPVVYEYAEPYRKSELGKHFHLCKTIPMPIDISNITFFNEIREKIVVFHGINRPEEKGTPHILRAMDMLQEEYPDRVQCIAKGGMPIADYLQLMRKTNIVIDQCYACSSGMNALFAQAMGKVVLGGNEPENGKEFNYDIPTLNISGDSLAIYEVLERLVVNPNDILELSKKSRKYIEDVHRSDVVAQQYITLFLKKNDSY